MEPTGHGQLYDLETYPVTWAEGSRDTPLACPNGCGGVLGGEAQEHLRELKVLQEKEPLISILQCRGCLKRWLRVEYEGVAQKR